MIKSHLGATENAGVLVTVQHVGQNVVVGGLGKGVLRYVGTVNGKDGIYCGIELLESAGKHDGTFQGTTYFVCPPERGIFAPTFRVKLDGGGDHGKPPELSSQLLSRSALPTLPLRHSNTSYEPQHPSMPLQIVPNGSGTQSEETVDADAMQMSMLSEMMYGSTCSIGSWGEGSMTMSNATFTVRKGASHDEEYDLMNVPMMKSVLNIDRESLRREEQRLQTSVVLGESRIGVECLPIIEDEELETPLVEMKLPGFTSTQVAPEIPEAVAKPVPDEQVDVNDNPTDVVPASNASKSNSTSTASSSATNTSTGCIERLTTQRNGQPKSNAVQKTSEKKVSAPAAPAPPRFPVKPKAPTKHQLMMEQLKASIEAEKARPKKEVKSRLSVVSPSSSTEKAERSDANAGPEDSKKSSRSLSIASKQQSCLVLGKSKKDGKLTSPPSAKVLTSSKPEISKDALCSKSGDITVAKRKQESKMAPASRVTNIASHKEKANKTDALGVARLDDVRKLALLQRACKMIDVLSLVAQQQCNQCEVYLTRKQKTLENLERATVRISKLEKRLVDDEKTNAEANQCARDRLEKVILKHDEEVQRLREQFDVEMKKVRQDCDRIVQEDHCRNEAEMMSMAVRHQKVVAVLDEKVAEAEKNSEQLRLDKKNLQFSLTNDSDQRNQVLWKEISSLQTALELKSAEMKELRQKNQQLSLLADEIPLKELEIAKWRHKTNEYRQNLDQKLFGEKMLLQQMEEMRRRQILDEEEKSAMKKNLDLLIFRMENGNSLEFPEETPKVQFRNSYSPRRPISSTGLTDDADRVDVMARSTLSMYTSQVRLPLNHSDDVIYAPDAIISSRSASSAQASKSIPFEDEPIIRESKSQSDSGIGTLT